MSHQTNPPRESGHNEDSASQGSSILPSVSPRTETGPTTDAESREVMLRAERRDSIAITDIERRCSEGTIHDSFTVVKRTSTYFGPELLLEANERNYLLTAPGPDTQLLLWGDELNERGYRENWIRLAEIRATIDETPQYDICDQCGYPIRSEEHERLARMGRCPDGSTRT